MSRDNEVRQIGLYDSLVKRDEALGRVESNATDEWKEAALDAVRYVAGKRREFTTDAVWSILERSRIDTHEPRAMGAIMRVAASHGYCESTDRTRQSVRPECHARPIRIWRSLMWKEPL